MYGYEYMKRLLKSEGFVIEQEDGAFAFKFESVNYVVFENETFYANVCIVYKLGKINRSKVLEVCNELNDTWHILKFVLKNGSIWCFYVFAPNDKTPIEDYLIVFRAMNESFEEMYEKLNN